MTPVCRGPFCEARMFAFSTTLDALPMCALDPCTHGPMSACGQQAKNSCCMFNYQSRRNLSERLRSFLKLLRIFEFEFCRRGNYFQTMRFFKCSDFTRTQCDFTFIHVLWRMYTHALMCRDSQQTDTHKQHTQYRHHTDATHINSNVILKIV